MNKYQDHFQTINLDDVTNRVILKDDAPQALCDLVRSIHYELFYDSLPNDWVYATIEEAFIELEEGIINADTEFDLVFWINIEADIYHNDLLRWLYENSGAFAIELCDQALEGSNFACGSFMEIIAYAQHMAKKSIYEAVFNFLKEHIDG